MSILVSIIVPVYNAEKYLERCITSVVSQSYTDIELILVDDGSSDSSREICEKWQTKDNRVRLISKENAGAGMARNTGLDYAKGDYVLFVDSDDYIERGAVSLCVAKLAEDKSDTVIFPQTILHEDNSPPRVIRLRTPYNVFEGATVRYELLPSMFTYSMEIGVSVWAKMFSLDLINKYNIRFYSEREYYSEDTLFVIEYFAKAQQVSILNENLYYYLSINNSLSRTYNSKREENLNRFLLKSLEIAEKENLPQCVCSAIKSKYHNYSMVGFKYIAACTESAKDRRALLRERYNDSVLRSTITSDVMALDKKSLRIFYTTIKYRLYCLSDFLLYYRNNK